MADRSTKAIKERGALQAKFPADFNAGARAGFLAQATYPAGFNSWSIEQRNAWFAGFNLGRVDRHLKQGKIHG